MSLKEKIQKILPFKIEEIKPDEKLMQLGLDSIKLVELVGIIEENTSLRIMEDTIYEIDGKWLNDLFKKYP
jgi:acyl carrier protein